MEKEVVMCQISRAFGMAFMRECAGKQNEQSRKINMVKKYAAQQYEH